MLISFQFDDFFGKSFKILISQKFSKNRKRQKIREHLHS